MKENGTFQFYTRTCMGKYYSEGTWQNVGDGYLLTSFDRYKDVKPEAVEPISAYEVGTEQEDELSMENNDTTTKLKSVS